MFLEKLFSRHKRLIDDFDQTFPNTRLKSSRFKIEPHKEVTTGHLWWKKTRYLLFERVPEGKSEIATMLAKNENDFKKIFTESQRLMLCSNCQIIFFLGHLGIRPNPGFLHPVKFHLLSHKE